MQTDKQHAGGVWFDSAVGSVYTAFLHQRLGAHSNPHQFWQRRVTSDTLSFENPLPPLGLFSCPKSRLPKIPPSPEDVTKSSVIISSVGWKAWAWDPQSQKRGSGMGLTVSGLFKFPPPFLSPEAQVNKHLVSQSLQAGAGPRFEFTGGKHQLLCRCFPHRNVLEDVCEALQEKPNSSRTPAVPKRPQKFRSPGTGFRASEPSVSRD